MDDFLALLTIILCVIGLTIEFTSEKGSKARIISPMILGVATLLAIICMVVG